jgi:hypothetical protein
MKSLLDFEKLRNSKTKNAESYTSVPSTTSCCVEIVISCCCECKETAKSCQCKLRREVKDSEHHVKPLFCWPYLINMVKARFW